MDGGLVGAGKGLRHVGVRVVQVAPEAGVGAAGGHASRVLALVGEVAAHGALLHHGLLRIVAAHAVGAGVHALLAADAGGLVHEDAALLVAVGGASGANLQAGGVLALLALQRQPVLLELGERAVGAHLDEVVPVHAQGHVVLVLTSNLAGMAADALVEVGD